MHDQILGRQEMPGLTPGADFFCRKHIPVSHTARYLLLQMIVYIVADKQIRLFFALSRLFAVISDFF
jgi:hypothetical protein